MGFICSINCPCVTKISVHAVHVQFLDPSTLHSVNADWGYFLTVHCSVPGRVPSHLSRVLTLGCVFTSSCLLLFFVLFCFFRDRVSMYSPGCPGTHSVDQAGLNSETHLPLPPRVLGLQVCATTCLLLNAQHTQHFVSMFLCV